jgi:hypothetical protein
MPGITPGTGRFLTLRSIAYLIRHDHNRVLPRYFFKHPLRYALRFLRSALRRHAYVRDGDFFLYGVDDVTSFARLLQDSAAEIVIGFSYCHKPHECPSGRFTPDCRADATHPVCRQCFIGKVVHALPPQRNITPLFIPTVHYIGEALFARRAAHPDKPLLFIITACELTLEMFGNWGNMIDAQGIGIRLDGRICNTMRAFELSEKGIKPGLTVVLPEAQRRLLHLIRSIWHPTESAASPGVHPL